jgi:3-methyladenine DNA glycosylase/8-oxoguanine DNA glycosylase
MKVTIEVECTPVEARSFLGLPDVTPLNDHLVEEMRKRFDANVAMLQPEELMRSWMSFGGQAQEHFMKLMSAAAGAGLGSKS